MAGRVVPTVLVTVVVLGEIDRQGQAWEMAEAPNAEQ